MMAPARTSYQLWTVSGSFDEPKRKRGEGKCGLTFVNRQSTRDEAGTENRREEKNHLPVGRIMSAHDFELCIEI